MRYYVIHDIGEILRLAHFIMDAQMDVAIDANFLLDLNSNFHSFTSAYAKKPKTITYQVLPIQLSLNNSSMRLIH